jgi:hypothetical protein
MFPRKLLEILTTSKGFTNHILRNTILFWTRPLAAICHHVRVYEVSITLHAERRNPQREGLLTFTGSSGHNTSVLMLGGA